MLLIIGLGNPGKKYEDTRHNIGFFMLEKIKEKWNFPEFEFSKKFNAYVSISSNPLLPFMGEGGRRPDEGDDNTNNKIILVKPQTFMNLSGTAIKSILDFYKLTPDNVLVIHDDLDIPLGKYKIATDSSSAGHNGVQNIIDNLGTQKFKRIRIGVGQSIGEALVCRLNAHDFVLEKFKPEELETIKKISEDILGEIENFL